MRHRIADQLHRVNPKASPTDTVVKRLIEETPTRVGDLEKGRAVQENLHLLRTPDFVRNGWSRRNPPFRVEVEAMGSENSTSPTRMSDPHGPFRRRSEACLPPGDDLEDRPTRSPRPSKWSKGFISGMHKSAVLRTERSNSGKHREYVPGRRHPPPRLESLVQDRQVFTSSNTRPKPTCAATDRRRRFGVESHYGVDKHRKAGTLNKYDYSCTAAACLGVYGRSSKQDSMGLLAFDQDVRLGF